PHAGRSCSTASRSVDEPGRAIVWPGVSVEQLLDRRDGHGSAYPYLELLDVGALHDPLASTVWDVHLPHRQHLEHRVSLAFCPALAVVAAGEVAFVDPIFGSYCLARRHLRRARSPDRRTFHLKSSSTDVMVTARRTHVS